MYRFIKNLFYPNKKFYRRLKRLLGFIPRNIAFYELAFTHRSASYISKDGLTYNNERLEYLGDAILDAVIADFLFHRFSDANEGFLTQMRSKIVNGERLSELAKKLEIPKLIISNTEGSASKKHIYGDALEALIGAIYIDMGYKVAMHFILRRMVKEHLDVVQLEEIDTNYKSKLIEWGQKNKREVVFYTDIESYNSKYFVSYVRVDNETFGTGIGYSKKQAEQKAARATLTMVGEQVSPDI